MLRLLVLIVLDTITAQGIVFNGKGGGATLSATCASKQPTLVWVEHDDALSDVTATLGNVAPTCAEVDDARVPCAADGSHVSPLFWCHYTGSDGTRAVGPYRATAHAHDLNGVQLGVRVQLTCPIPPQEAVAEISGGFTADDYVASVTYSVTHFAEDGDSALALPYTGVPGQNVIKILVAARSPPGTPSSPSPPPPSPAPSPPACGWVLVTGPNGYYCSGPSWQLSNPSYSNTAKKSVDCMNLADSMNKKFISYIRIETNNGNCAPTDACASNQRVNDGNTFREIWENTCR